MATAGAMIRQARRGKGLTQQQLADAVGIDFTYCSKIECGKDTPPASEETYRSLAALLGLDGDALVAASGRWTKVRASDLAALRAELEALADDVQCIDPEELQYGHVAWVAGCIRAVAAKL